MSEQTADIMDDVERRRLAGKADALRLAARQRNLDSLLGALTVMLEQASGGAARAAFLVLEHESRTLRHCPPPRLPEGFWRAMEGAPLAPETGPFTVAMLSGSPVACDMADDSAAWPGFRAAALGYGLRSCWSVSVESSRGEALGALTLYYTEERRPGPAELDTVQTVLDAAVVAIERSLAEREHERLRDQIRERDRMKDEFLATLAHELRNPLAPIRTGLELLRLRADDPAALERVRAIIERQSNLLVRLVDDLLDISRITRGTVKLRKERVEAAAVLARAVEATRGLIESRRHKLDLALPTGAVELVADPARLEQVLVHLLSNAANNTDPGGTIGVSVLRDQDQVVFRIRDNGIGIAASMLARIFEPFVQAERSPSRPHGGLGLGLTLVRSLVHMHGGMVEAGSAGAGQGSEFVVTLPAGRLDEAVLPAPAVPAPLPAVGLGTTRRRRVMVVDDSADAAESLATFLAACGHSVRVAHDGQSAIQAAVAFRPEVVLLDIGLPQMDGYEVARRMRTDLGLDKVKILAVTGYAQDADRDLALASGFDDHLIKPVDPVALRALLEQG